ncbi:MAG: hypothetical protein KGJ13_08310 [Patescibacteria group bacterium]|nr:hypothetical protein [Patescibacteria group bacterium]
MSDSEAVARAERRANTEPQGRCELCQNLECELPDDTPFVGSWDREGHKVEVSRDFVRRAAQLISREIEFSSPPTFEEIGLMAEAHKILGDL